MDISNGEDDLGPAEVGACSAEEVAVRNSKNNATDIMGTGTVEEETSQEDVPDVQQPSVAIHPPRAIAQLASNHKPDLDAGQRPSIEGHAR